MTDSKKQLCEILHKPVTFTNESLQKDTAELNKSLSEGYTIQEFVRTETGIVYVLGKWNENSQKENEKNDQTDNNLKQIYEEFLEEAK